MMRRVVPVVLMVAVAGWVDAVGLLYFLGHRGFYFGRGSPRIKRSDGQDRGREFWDKLIAEVVVTDHAQHSQYGKEND